MLFFSFDEKNGNEVTLYILILIHIHTNTAMSFLYSILIVFYFRYAGFDSFSLSMRFFLGEIFVFIIRIMQDKWSVVTLSTTTSTATVSATTTSERGSKKSKAMSNLEKMLFTTKKRFLFDVLFFNYPAFIKAQTM